MAEDKVVSLENMTDEQIMNMDNPEDLIPVDPNEEEAAKAASEDKSAGDNPDPDNPDGEADGAAAEEGSAEGEGDDAGSASGEREGDSGKQESQGEGQSEASGDDQSSEEGSEGSETAGDDPGELDHKAEYKRLMEPFKAAKRMVTVGSVDDARRLMQQGVDYSRKMELMKPHLRALRTLEKAELLDPDRINFLIDLHKKDPAAIKKLLKDADIDPMTVSNEDSDSYTPTDHAISEAELGVREVLDNIKDSDSFTETVDVISNQLDKASREKLQGNPEVIATIHEHIEAGVYTKVMDKVKNERLFGRLSGLSDLDAYYQVGDAMHKAGDFGDPDSGKKATSAAGDNSQGSEQDSGSGSSKEEDAKNRKRAAKPGKGGSGGGGKVAPDFSKMSDQQILDFEESSLN